MSSPSSLHRLVQDRLADCRARGLSPKTLRDAYGYPLQSVLLPWCEQEGLTAPGRRVGEGRQAALAGLAELGDDLAVPTTMTAPAVTESSRRPGSDVC